MVGSRWLFRPPCLSWWKRAADTERLLSAANLEHGRSLSKWALFGQCLPNPCAEAALCGAEAVEAAVCSQSRLYDDTGGFYGKRPPDMFRPSSCVRTMPPHGSQIKGGANVLFEAIFRHNIQKQRRSSDRFVLCVLFPIRHTFDRWSPYGPMMLGIEYTEAYRFIDG